jgi:hypothetical protein
VTHTFDLDPYEIVGVSASAPLEEIRESYRTKTKKHHPDHGGDEWAFRVLTRSYEILCRARIAGRVSEELARAAEREPVANPSGPVRPPRADLDPGRARRGVRDRLDNPARLVAAEMLLIRFEVDDPLLFLSESPEERTLSCSLNVAWPIPDEIGRAERSPDAARILAAVAAAFDAVKKARRVHSARVASDANRFSGWLSFTTVSRAEDGFKALRAELSKSGLGVEQWVRELAIPRYWSE